MADDIELDPNVIAGRSFSVKTLRIEVELQDGDVQVLFKKGASGDAARNMMLGTFESETTLHSFIPEYVPRPIAWGPETCPPDTYFFLCEFVDMDDEVPNPADWAKAVATLHMRSMGKSPNGMFGFQASTHLAKFPVNNTWSQSWEALWAQQMHSMFAQEEEKHGRDEELERLKGLLFNEVIPRYLRPLETDGRSIQPCLVHSDLWPGNIKPKLDETEVCMFDSCGFWGHNEVDLSICYNPRYRLGKPWVVEYQKYIPASEPVADFEDRKRLYALKFHVLLSVMHKDPSFRQVVVDEITKLVERSRASNGVGHAKASSANRVNEVVVEVVPITPSL